jgi:hypothetical protein
LLHVFPVVATLGTHEAAAGAGQNAQLDATGGRPLTVFETVGCPRSSDGSRLLTFLRRLPGRLDVRLDLRHPALKKLARLSLWTLAWSAGATAC